MAACFIATGMELSNLGEGFQDQDNKCGSEVLVPLRIERTLTVGDAMECTPRL
jgi:hypothetical protein